jgi:MoaA/NifB/PqqE/SkfB family radical SAM enzyme
MNEMTDIFQERMKRLPLPKADAGLYSEIMARGFEAYPARKKNFELYQSAQRAEVVEYLPIKLDIENVSRCNFRCSMCQVSKWPKQQRAADMPLADFEALIENLVDGLVEIKIQGMGEPLMNADDYISMIKFARERHIWVRSTVNGSLLHLNENYKRIIDADVCEIHVSVDGATQETFENIRHGSKYSMVTKNAALLNDYARQQGRMRTRMWTVGQKDNFHEFEKFPYIAADLGFNRLSVSLDLNDWGQDDWRDRNDQFDIQKEFTFDLAQSMIDNGKKNGVEVTFWFLDRKFSTTSPERLCAWPFERAYISSDMRFVPCCMMSNPSVMNMGDANTFMDVWNNEKMVEFRAAHVSGNIPEVCKSCYE